MPIFDTHLHLVYPDRFSYPWLSGVPALQRPFTAEAYFAEAEALGIVAALHMEVDVAPCDQEAETRLACALHDRIVGAVAGCRPEDEDFAERLEVLIAVSSMRGPGVRGPGVKGLRRILHTQDDALSQTPTFIANVRRLADARLPFDLCLAARQLPLGASLADRCPDVSFVLDHCGNPPIADGDLAAWRADVSALAERPNVCAKISGLVNHAGPNWRVADLRPVAEHVIAAFGWDRVVWGSDHPVCTLAGTGLAAWVEASREIVAGCSADERARLFHANARRLYAVAVPG